MEFQELLLQVEQSLSKTDAQGLVFLSVDLLGRDLSSLSSTGELFSLLMNNDFLSSENTSLLTELLHTCHRQDLIRQLGLRTAQQPGESLIGPYRKLLFELSENITEKDLKSMKFLLFKTLPRSKLHDKMTTLQLLMELEKEDLLSSENLDILKKCLSSVCPILTKRIDQFKRETDRSSNQLPNQINIGHIFQETAAGKISVSEMVVGSQDALSQHPSNISFDEPRPPSCFCKELSPSTEHFHCCPQESRIVGASEHPEELESLSLSSTDNSEVQSFHFSVSVPVDLKQGSHNVMDLPKYDMKGDKRGVCLIINNHEFSKSVTPLGNRDGTQFDETRLKEVFEWLGFEVEVRRDCTKQQILCLLKEVSRRDHSQVDCFVCCMLSHGLNGTIYGVDGNQVRLQQFTEPFSGHLCPSLKEKPKLFFIQACQGHKEQQIVFLQTDGPGSLSSNAGANSIPADADFLLGMATTPEYASFRDRKEGTWFIQSLCEKLQLLVPEGVDLLTILTEVNNDVSKKAYGIKKQMPQPVYSLRKRIIFPIPSSPRPCRPAKKTIVS
ncbi:caspase-8 isoform X3 [Alosa pseudoharengus]|uniref:caspase-8 isoform X3 n=1 Tax=Alosa pseudoharengus TaxID=34774 RepID=UPI003F89EE35